MLVLGISGFEHDAAAALFDSSRLVAAIEEDKLAGSSPTIEIPRLAIEHCLRVAGAPITDVALAGVASRPMRAWLRNKRLHFMTLVSSLRALHRIGSHDGVSWKVNQLQFLTHQLSPQVTAARELQPPFWVNTSFNLFGEPLVCDPRDAVRSYASSAIDALVIDNYLL